MANKQTRSLTESQYFQMVSIIQKGFITKGGRKVRGNPRIATILVLEANIFARISDILQLKLSSIVRDGDRYRLDIVEKKTKKKRCFTVPVEIYTYIQDYAINNGIKKDELLFDVTARQVQKHIQLAAEFLGIECISTHSFRKYAATSVYNQGKNIFLVKELLQHSSVITTQKYINISRDEIERALQQHIKLPT